MTDVGTREQHLFELLELWQDTEEWATDRPSHSQRKLNILEELEIAIAFLRRTLTAGTQYNENFYRFAINGVYRDRDKILPESRPESRPE
jgi:hypothetical protein